MVAVRRTVGKWGLISYTLPKQIFNRLNHQVLYFTCMVVGCEDTVNQSVLSEKTAITINSSERNTKVLFFLLFDIFFKVTFLTIV